MTVQEAIKELQVGYLGDTEEIVQAKHMGIKALEEVEQYRALGTVEEIKKKIKTELPYMSLAQARFKSELDEYRKIGTVEELKEAREKQPKTDWILCEERLPKNEGRYLTCDKKGNIHVFYHHASLEYPFEIGENHLQYYPPVAWQPLPQPYKKEGAEDE